MTNPFYNASGNPGDRAPGSSQTMRAEFVSIQQGFDKLPTSLSPNAIVVVNPGGTALTTTAYALALGGALTLAGAFTTTGPYATTLAQQANTTLTLPASNATLATLALAETLTNKTLTAPVLNTPTVNNGTFNAPTLVTPQLGTPASGNLANCTALPIATGVSGLAAGVATFLGAPSSANLRAAMSDETGWGLLVFGTSPTLTTPTLNNAVLTAPSLGTPASGNLSNCTSLPLTTGVSGVLGQANGGTGSAGPVPQNAIWFGGAGGTLGWDAATFNWNNATKSLGIGAGASGDGIRRVLIKSYAGAGAYPLIIQNGSGTAEAFAVQQDASGNFGVVVGDTTNARRVWLNSAGDSYFLGGNVGIGAGTPTAHLGVMGPSGLTNPGDEFRVGSFNYDRFLRLGILNVDNGGGTINQAPFIQSNYNNSTSLAYNIHLNPIGGNVNIGSFRQPAAALDVNGSVAVSDAQYVYTPYNGATNVGGVRAGIQLDGAGQNLNFITSGTYRGGVLANGNMYLGARLGVGMTPAASWSANIQTSADITMASAVTTLFWNGYYDGTWRYAANGWAAALRTDGAGLLNLFAGAQNTGGVGAVWSTLTNVMSFNLGTGNVGIGANPSGRRLLVSNNVNGENAVHIANASIGAGAFSILYVDLSSVGNGYGALSVNYNSGAPFMRLAAGAAVSGGIIYSSDSVAAGSGHYFYAAGTMQVSFGTSSLNTIVPVNIATTAANAFNNILLQGDGTNGYIRTTNAGFLYLGANNQNGAFAHQTGLFPATSRTNVLGNSSFIWGGLETVIARFYGNTSGATTINAQAVAANNVVTLPPYNGTLLIGGTQLSANLGGDVALNNTGSYFNGPSIALPAGGTWFVTAGMTLQDYNSAANFEARLIEGSNVYASALLSTWASGAGTTVVLSGFLPGGTTAVVQAIGNSSVFGRILATSLGGGGGQPNATWMRAIRVA